MAEAWHLTEQLVAVFNARETIWAFALVGYGGPLLFVIPSLAVWPNAYGSEAVCWINPAKETPAIWFFVAPALLCFLFCIGSLIRIMRSISDTTKSRWTQLKAFVTFGAVLGLTQVFGALMAVDADNVAFAYLFAVGLCSQGVLIMYFHLFRKQKFKDGWSTMGSTRRKGTGKGGLRLSSQRRPRLGSSGNSAKVTSTATSIIAEGVSIHGKEDGAVSSNPMFEEGGDGGFMDF